MLNIHAHLSEYEVIGYLGGFCFDSKTSSTKCKKSSFKYTLIDLLIQSAYPCESLIEDPKERLRNVDLCPESADLATTQIHAKG